MYKTILFVVAAVLCAGVVYAQGPFNDVPTDHWAYDAVNQLQKDGIVIGYPDGTFGGKRAMTRYEFAVAIARLMPLLGDTELPEGLVTNAKLQDTLSGYAKKSDIPDISKLATKSDVDAIRRLVDEFRDEIAALGVDVDALKRDVAALGARVDAIEAELQRVRITGDVNVFAISAAADEGTVYDLDNRYTNSHDAGGSYNTLMRGINVVRDFDLNIVGRVSDTVTANATINYGNYLRYLDWGLDDYSMDMRDTEWNDRFHPYYLYINAEFAGGDLTVGRFPLQFTPYTLRMIDTDYYTDNWKTDSGDYPVDGIKMAWDWSGADLTLYAAKHDDNAYLYNGLTAIPNTLMGNWHDYGAGGSVGTLDDWITQSAGGRLTFGNPGDFCLGLTFYQAWSYSSWDDGDPFDQARVYGADVAIPLGANWGIEGSWTACDLLANDKVGGPDIDDDNTAWDAKITGSFGKLGLTAGYKRIERNFAPAGSWGRIGLWVNPVNIKGPYAKLDIPLGSSLSLTAAGEFYEFIDWVDVDVTKAQGTLSWQLSQKNAFDVDYQWIEYDPAGANNDGTESYLTLGLKHMFSPNADMKIGYQFIKWDPDALGGFPYGPDYKGGIGVVQFGVSF